MTKSELIAIKLRLDEAEQTLSESPESAVRSAGVAAVDVARWMWDVLNEQNDSD